MSLSVISFFFFFNDTATTEIYTLSLHDALPIFRIPVLTMHTKGDGLVLVQNESAYHTVVTEADNSAFLRETFVDRAGHCTFTPSETITAVQSLLTRLDTGTWGPLDATTMNAAAFARGPGSNIVILPPPPGSLPGTPPIILPTPPAYLDRKSVV